MFGFFFKWIIYGIPSFTDIYMDFRKPELLINIELRQSKFRSTWNSVKKVP